MSHWCILLFILSVSHAENNSSVCNRFQANFDLLDIIGTWHVVAIIPEKLFPEQKRVSCYEVEFSEIDEAGLRWLLNRTVESRLNEEYIGKKQNGLVIRQRYNTEKPFDVWSKEVKGVKGCFQQVLSLDTAKSDVDKAITQHANMQLHILNTKDKTGPYLVQTLWGNLISAVIYKRHLGVTQDQLRPVFEFMSKRRGPQRLPKLCDVPLKKLIVKRVNRKQ